ncbi:MAG: rhodanese-like domain-containing protein [Betaproteobacteria bacterium]
MPQLAPAELHGWRADAARRAPVLVDVREPWEFERCKIEGAISVPLSQLQARIAELSAEQDLILVCHHGSRSQQAAMFLARNGFSRVYNLRGGVEAWAVEVDPAMPRY